MGACAWEKWAHQIRLFLFLTTKTYVLSTLIICMNADSFQTFRVMLSACSRKELELGQHSANVFHPISLDFSLEGAVLASLPSTYYLLDITIACVTSLLLCDDMCGSPVRMTTAVGGGTYIKDVCPVQLQCNFAWFGLGKKDR